MCQKGTANTCWAATSILGRPGRVGLWQKQQYMKGKNRFNPPLMLHRQPGPLETEHRIGAKVVTGRV